MSPKTPTDPQSLHILTATRSGWVSPLEAVRRFGILRLAARIFDLRALGWDFEERWETEPGSRKRFKAFRLKLAGAPPLAEAIEAETEAVLAAVARREVSAELATVGELARTVAAFAPAKQPSLFGSTPRLGDPEAGE